jgi:uncharacterized phage-associated protein
MTTAHDVAAYILERCGPMPVMKLHKLLYYCQAWSLVWDERPLFPERIEAWANGPVVPEIYEYHRGHFKIDKWPPTKRVDINDRCIGWDPDTVTVRPVLSVENYTRATAGR